MLFAPPETGPGERNPPGVLEEIAYRRCPVGLIAALDCPEFVATRCRHHDPRGDRPKAVVPRTEVALLAAELADGGYLTEAYRRRLRGLRVELPPPRPLAAFVPSTNAGADAGPAATPPASVPSRRPRSALADRARVPVNVASDDARRRAVARRRVADGPPGPVSP